MRKQTDLAKVKQTALALLSTEINETPYSPMIVKHPFTDTGVSAIPDGKGGVEMIDGRTVIVKREKICDNCGGAQPAVVKDDEVTLFDFLSSLSADQQRAALVHLSVLWAEKQAAHSNMQV